MLIAPNADRFKPLAEDVRSLWMGFGQSDTVHFPKLVGLTVEDVRQHYCRMRLPFRTEVSQPQGIMHGGAIATAVDSVVVPAIAAHYQQRHRMSTIDLSVQFVAPVTSDVIIEGWVTKRGRSVVFCQSEVWDTSQELVAFGTVTYKLGGPVTGS
ncbi:MAG: PaaI family thioesterase [Acidimicrobiia bacterium]|nr:PaaI family thioesterase [Acidimicrobiia bacterium]